MTSLILMLTLAHADLPNRSDLIKWGKESLFQIRQDFAMPSSDLFAEDYTKKKIAFNWSAGVLLSAYAAAAKVDPGLKPLLRSYANAVDKYWDKTGPVAGFDSFPGLHDRYYDDNAWMVLALLDTYEVLKDKKYLNRAKLALDYVLSGEDSKLGGGIYWREKKKTSKNTCSNAPSAFACIRMGWALNNRDLVEHGRKLADWTGCLKDPSDHLYWDNIGLSGKIDKTKWSYNTALMIRSRVALADSSSHLEADASYTVATEIGSSALAHWFDPTYGCIKDEAAFAHLLCDALVDLDRGTEKFMPSCLAALRNLYNRRDASSHYPQRWDGEGHGNWRLLDQASAARAFFYAAGKMKDS